MTATVAVLGGGIGGLSAAHELAERGFDVTVYEQRGRFGGKARSVPVPGSDGDGDGEGPPLPGEHGFRFFPGFYRHVTDTMARIPYGDRTVRDNLVTTSQTLLANGDGTGVTMPTETPRSVREWRELLASMLARDRVPREEANFFVDRLLVLLSSSEARREAELERTPWWEFIDAENRSPAYRTALGYGITQSLVAMRPQVSSTRTIGRIYLQMIRGLFDPSIDADALLNGPTNEVWIQPWVEYLSSLGVALRPNTAVRAIHCDGRRVTGVTVEDSDGGDGGDGRSDGDASDGGEREVEADYYVAAMPVGPTRDLLTEDLLAGAPSLAGLDRLETAWMNGLQFYLREDVPTAHGHVAYHDAPWALTSISQRQFWDEFDVRDCGDGSVEGVLSVIISDWETPGVRYGKPAKECTPEEIRAEVLAQMRSHLGGDPAPETIHDWFLDPAIVPTGDGVENREPLLVNTAGSLAHRPEADTDLPNLTLAADYVRTHTDLASMEGANEAARRAVNAILDREDASADRCQLWEFEEPAVFAPLKAHDAVQHRLGLPHPGAVSKRVWRVALDATASTRF